MKEEVFEAVLNEILEDQKPLILILKDLQQQVAVLTEKVASFDQRLNSQIVAPPVDTRPLEQQTEKALAQTTRFLTAALDKIDQRGAAISGQLNDTLKTGLQKTNTILEAQPKPIIRQWRISFFPEPDRQGSYRLFLNRLTIVICILAALIVLFLLGNIWLNNIHSERVNASHAFRDPLPPASSPSQYSPPNPSPITHHHHPSSPSSGSQKKRNPDSLQTTYPAITDSSHTP